MATLVVGISLASSVSASDGLRFARQAKIVEMTDIPARTKKKLIVISLRCKSMNIFAHNRFERTQTMLMNTTKDENQSLYAMKKKKIVPTISNPSAQFHKVCIDCSNGVNIVSIYPAVYLYEQRENKRKQYTLMVNFIYLLYNFISSFKQ